MLQPFEIFSKCLRSLGLSYLDGMAYFKYLCHQGYGLEHPLVRPTSQSGLKPGLKVQKFPFIQVIPVRVNKIQFSQLFYPVI